MNDTMMMPITVITDTIEEQIDLLGSFPVGIHCPDGNKGNIYLKTCWLLSVWKKEVLEHPSAVAKDNVAFLEEVLPRIRTMVNMKEGLE